MTEKERIDTWKPEELRLLRETAAAVTAKRSCGGSENQVRGNRGENVLRPVPLCFQNTIDQHFILLH